jgi:hypothetical protein
MISQAVKLGKTGVVLPVEESELWFQTENHCFLITIEKLLNG